MNVSNHPLRIRISAVGKPIRLACLRHGSLLVFALIASLALCSPIRAVNPPPDGGYPNGNTAEGNNALFSLTTGFSNTAIGDSALFTNSTGGNNTATGVFALHDNSTGFSNTANGSSALRANTTGSTNTATGDQALETNTTGKDNTAMGVSALTSNTTGINNTAIGRDALRNNDTGNNSTAMGYFALAQQRSIPSPSFIPTGNTAIGAFAMTANGAGSENTAVGDRAASNGGGFDNTALGALALFTNRGGSANTAIGRDALGNSLLGNQNTAVGYRALLNTGGTIGGKNGDNNIAIGNSAGINLTTGDYNIDIGNFGVAGESGKIRIGTAGNQTATFIAGISGVAVTGSQVVVNANGKLGVAASSSRFKQAIEPMDKASEDIFDLKPVAFRYKEEIDPYGLPQYGLIAEEVEKINPDLVTRDEEGKVTTVRYEAVNAMLLNEFLKQHRKALEQEATINALKATVAQQEKTFQATTAEQQKEVKALTASLKEQASAIRKVSDEMKLSNASPQLIASEQ